MIFIIMQINIAQNTAFFIFLMQYMLKTYESKLKI